MTATPVLTNTGMGSIILGGTTTASVLVNSPMQTTAKLTVGDIDVGQTLELLLFFLQSQYPDIVEQFNAIKKIKES